MDGQALNFRIGGDASAFERAVNDARKEAQALNRDVSKGFHGSSAAGRQFVRAANDASVSFRKMGGGAKLASFQMLNLTRQGNDVITMLAMGARPMQVFTSQAGQVYDALSSGPGGLVGGLKGLGNSLLGVATRFWPVTAALAVIGGGLLGMEHAINSTSKTTVSFGNVALATWHVIRDGIWSVLKPAFEAISPWASAAWNGAASIFKTVGNTIIGIGVATVDGILAAWNGFPGAIGDLAFQAADKFYAGMTFMIRSARVEINSFIGSINGSLAKTGIQLPDLKGGLIGLNPNGTQKHLTNPFAGAAAPSGVDSAIKGAMSKDYLGEFYNAVKKNAVALAEAGEAGDKAGKKIGGAAKKAADPWKGLREVTDKTAKKMQEASEAMGKNLGGTLRGLADGSMKLKDALISVGQSILKYFNQVNIAKGGSGLFGGGLFGGIMQGLLGFAKGGVFSHGGVTAFARGGVVSSPTLFKFARGTGLMGEAGPEAIMPLRRGADGRLGVAASNGNGRPAANQNLHITFGMKIDQEGNIRPFVENVAVGVTQSSLSKYDKNLPNRINQYNERGI